MNKRVKVWAVLACIVIVGAAVLMFAINAKGAPAVDVAAYVQAAEPDPATELAFLPDGDGAVPGMKRVAQTDALSLHFNPETTEIAVRDRKSGKLWRSNPEGREQDAKASAFEKERLSSQFTIDFRDAIGTLFTFNNFAESVRRGQFKAESVDGGIRVTYTLGDLSLGIDALPKKISRQRLEEKVLSKLDEATAKYVLNRYYPSEDNPDVLERLDEAVSRPLVLKRMLEAFAAAGYTEEDLAHDNEENGIAGGAADRPHFTVPVEYRLDGDSLVVRVLGSRIEESEGYKIRQLELLPFFGAAGTDEQGYMLVPDGSGSLIYLNNGKNREEAYAQRIYGEDQNNNSRRRGQVAEAARLPVFGLKSGDHAWFAVVEQGDGIASVNADVSGRMNNWNYVYASFRFRGEDTLELYKGNEVEEIQLLTEARFTGDVQVRYRFLSGDDADYSGMARLYRESLVRDGVLKPREAEGDLPFYLDVLGAVDKRKSFLGVPYKGLVPMTTFEEAGVIARRLQEGGVSNLQMRYLGWFNGGLNHKIPDAVKAVGALGGQSGLQRLAGQLREAGGTLYPDVAFQHVFRDDWHFSPAADAARFITRETARLAPYHRALNRMDDDLGPYYLLSPAKLPYFVDRFIAGFGRFGIDAVSLRDLGDRLHADYRVNRLIFRETAKRIVAEQLGKLEERFGNVMIAGGNAYALRYADHLVNVPMSSSGFSITDEEIPFYQMVVHGYLDYGGPPINLHDEQDVQWHLLRAVEYGAAPHFLWSYESSSELKFTPYDHLFSTAYTAWIDEAIDMYRRVNEALAGLRSRPMAERIVHEPGVVEVRYENGTSVYVNYTEAPVTVNGVRVEAKNFAVDGERG